MQNNIIWLLIGGLCVACILMDIQVILNHRRIKKLEERLE